MKKEIPYSVLLTNYRDELDIINKDAEFYELFSDENELLKIQQRLIALYKKYWAMVYENN